MRVSHFVSRSEGIRSGDNTVAGPDPERTQFTQTSLHLRGPLSWGSDPSTDSTASPLTLNFLLPYVEIEQYIVASDTRNRLDGVGDLSVYLEGQNNEKWSWLAGLKFPTGDAAERPGPGLTPPSLLQVGSGTFDPILGLQYIDDDGGDVVRMASGIFTFPIDESDGGLRAGRTLRVSIGGYWRTGSWLNPSMQLEWLRRDPDRLDSSTLSNTGATLWTLVPAFKANIGDRSFIQASWRLPLTQDVNGTQMVPGTGFMIEGGIRF